MPINFPTFQQQVDNARTDVRAELPSTDPTVFGSFLRALTDCVGTRSYDLNLLIQQLLEQAFPQTASGEFIERWAGYEGLSRLAATQAEGGAVITGTAGTTVPVNTPFTSAAGDEYVTQSATTIVAQSFTITALTSTGSTATATAAGHNLATGVTITVAGANESEYNGSFVVTVTGPNTFTYSISGSPASPATGSITGSFNGAVASFESTGAGASLNLTSGALLSITSPLAGVDDAAYTRFDGIDGGSDVETDAALRARVLQSRSNIVANFNAAAIERQALQVPGVTRVFVKEITPSVGDVTVYFLRDNDADPFPDASEVAAVKAKIVEILPAPSDLSNVYVSAPTPVTTNYTFSSITPDTATMRAAIEANLEAFYEDSVQFETTITEDKYRSAIIETQDTETGDFLQSFTLSGPSGDITVTDGEIGTLGTVSFT